MTPRAIFYDTETTGIQPANDRVVEIAAFDPANGRQFVRLVNPGRPIPPEATAIHKITNEMVSEAPSFAEIADEFTAFCGDDAILVAHNNDAFDIHFLRHEYRRAERELPSWKFVDTLKWARCYRPDLPRHTLQFLREIYNITANDAHRALDDVLVLHQVYEAMTDDLSIDLVHSMLSQPRELRTMPFGKHRGQPLAKLPKEYILWLAGSGALDKSENSNLKEALTLLGALS